MLKSAVYGTLALAANKKPYAVPVNYVYYKDAIYFHSSPKGKKMRILAKNNQVSFNIVCDDIFIPSYFSSDDGLACPASAFFKSIIIDGKAEIIKDYDELKEVFSALMQSLQPDGKYKHFDNSEYGNEFKALVLVKINIESLTAKFKYGQNMAKKRQQMVIKHLKQRGRKIDLLTIDAIKQFSKYKL